MQTSAGNRFFFGRVRGGVMGNDTMKLCNIEVILLVIIFHSYCWSRKLCLFVIFNSSV